MKFCMFTTFFGPHSFGGDAAFVDRLSRALARRGHEVQVVYCRDAFEMVRGDQTPRPYEPPPGVRIHPLSSPFGALSPLATHQTGRPWFKGRAIRRLLRSIRPDVVHFHNLSLVGGPGLLGVPAPGAIKLLTTHEHWLVCPLHVLWKFDREVCRRPECVRCCLHDRKPPQPWRATGLLRRSLRHLDALICPSRSTQRSHAERGITAATTHLPYFLPEDYTGLPARPEPNYARPYFVAAGRLEKIKGFQDAIDAMRHLPDVDLRVAGSGRFEPELRAQAAGLPNVHFEGRLDSAALAALFRGARGVVVPSIVFETFGYVVLEAFHEHTPVVVRDLGALPELVAESGGGLVFDSAETLVAALRRLADDDEARRSMGEHGHQARRSIWSEESHMGRYFALIEECRRKREGRGNPRKLALSAAAENVTSRPGPAPPHVHDRPAGWHGSPGSPIAGARRP
jgi:glycosyltransferase involved in cell wall biosynthesis